MPYGRFLLNTNFINSLKNRFYSKVLLPDKNGCMEWIGASNKRINDNHGRFIYDNKFGQAHRFSYELHYGKIPNNLLVLHKCDNPPCVNPEHLWIGTQKENMRDMRLKGRSLFGERHPNHILTDKEVKEIKIMLLNHENQCYIAKIYNISQSVVSQIKRNITWRNE